MARYHLDTSFVIDWERGDPRIAQLADEISEGDHEISFDPIVETEFFAGQKMTRQAELLFRGIERLAVRVDLASTVCRLAATWLSSMDGDMRKQHFGDALIAAAASSNEAALLSADQKISRVFPIDVVTY